MNTIRALLILLISITFLPPTSAQINKANKLFNLYRYSEAIPYYIKVAETGKDTKHKAVAVTRLADCYRFTNNPEMASEWYSMAIQLENIDPVNFLYYGQALQNQGYYINAKSAFLKYSQMVPEDPRGSAYAVACDMPDRWENTPPEFEILNMTSLNSEWSDFGPSYYKNGLIFTSDRREDYIKNIEYGWTNNSFLDIYFSEPENAENPYGEMKKVTSFSKNFNHPYHDGPAAYSPGDGTMYLTRSYNDRTTKKNRIKNHMLKIFYAQTNGRSWSDEKPFFLNSEDYSVAHPSIDAKRKTIFFSSDMPGGYGASDIWYCTWESDKWSLPENLGKDVNSFGNEVFPFILNDSTLFFASNGLPGYGGLDIFVTKKKDDKWQTPINIRKPVNSSYDDFSFILDASGNQGFFSSNRPEGLGSDDLYACKRLPELPETRQVAIPKSKTFFISGYVKDKNSLQPVSGASVYMLNTKTDKVKVLRTNSEGFYKSVIDINAGYLIKATKLNNLADCFSFSPPGATTAIWLKAPRDLLLDKLEVNKVFKLGNIYFDLDKWNLRPDAVPDLDNLVKIMKENPISVELASHTDCHGTFADNDVLSQKRAESAVKYIIQSGIGKDRIIAKGYGERKLTNHCTDGVECSPAEHQANRRTEFKITAVSASFLQNNNKTASYKEGIEIDRSLLAPDFFDDCIEQQ
jgi:outer membrane protein OmpA-like peptidoglycan-associated protein/tetratricopeptide (TPR) repeat protein